MSFKAFLTGLTKHKKEVPAQVVLKNGMNIVCPRRLDHELDQDLGHEAYEAAYDDFKHEEPCIFVGMLVMPVQVPGGPTQSHLVKSVFDPVDVSAVIFLPEEVLAKISSDRAPAVPRGGRTPSGLVIP